MAENTILKVTCTSVIMNKTLLTLTVNWKKNTIKLTGIGTNTLLRNKYTIKITCIGANTTYKPTYIGANTLLILTS